MLSSALIAMIRPAGPLQPAVDNLSNENKHEIHTSSAGVVDGALVTAMKEIGCRKRASKS